MPELRVRRDDIGSCELVETEPLGNGLDEGEALLRIERFALTANNVTYAAMGDRLGYWRLFPAPEGWGRIPAWGYARVVAARATGVADGQRVFGAVPMGSYMTVCPEPRAAGFADTAPHRSDLSPVYNRYLSIEGAGDDAELVMRPLFATSVILDLVLADGRSEEATMGVLTSASSKTAYGLAHLLRARQVEVIGLTSALHHDWVEGLGLYDAVLAYDDVGALSAPGGAVLVDFAGNHALLRKLHEQLGEQLRRSVRVGFAHRQLDALEDRLPGPATEFFFAPDEMVRRGRDLGRRWAAAWRDFAPVVQRTMRIERVMDGAELVRVYRELFEGRVDPAAGYVVSV